MTASEILDRPAEASHVSPRLLAASVFLVATLGAFLISGPSLTQPPVWDGAMSVYPAAIELVRSDFNFPYVLSLPKHFEGGPNTHTISPWTLLVAFGISQTGDLESLLPVLHIASLLLYGATCLAIFYIVRRSSGDRLALLASVVAGLFPPLLVQATDIYLDLPVACLTIWAIYTLLIRRFRLSSVLIALAIWFKPTGAIYIPMLVAHSLRYGPPRRKAVHTAGVVSLPLGVLVAVSSFATPVGVESSPLPRLLSAWNTTGHYLASVPDTLFIVVVAIGLVTWCLKRGLTEPMEMAIFVLAGAFGFALFNGLTTIGIPLVPRYYIGIIPVVIAGVITQFATFRRKWAAVAASIMAIVFIANFSGRLYPYGDHATYSVAERSFAYRNLLEIQRLGIVRLEQIGQFQTVLYDYFRFYQFSYPEMGYTRGPPQSGLSVFHTGRLTLTDLPDRFAFLYEYPTIGGEHLLALWDEAKASNATVSETPIRSGRFTVYIVEVDQ